MRQSRHFDPAKPLVATRDMTLVGYHYHPGGIIKTEGKHAVDEAVRKRFWVSGRLDYQDDYEPVKVDPGDDGADADNEADAGSDNEAITDATDTSGDTEGAADETAAKEADAESSPEEVVDASAQPAETAIDPKDALISEIKDLGGQATKNMKVETLEAKLAELKASSGSE